MRFPFAGKPDREAELFAEASALVDDGLDRDFVLALYPDDADWLAPLLETRRGVVESFEAEQPSYFFEASLKSKFLAAGRESQAPVGEPVAVLSMGRVSTVMASTGVVLTAAVMSVLTLAFVTADGAVPGDWNYSFKLAQERLEYRLARGDSRLDVQISQAQERVNEINKRGDNVSKDDIERLAGELTSLESLAKDKELDDVQKAQIGALQEGAKAVLTPVGEKRPTIEPLVRTTINQVDGIAAAAGVGGGTSSVTSPSPTASPSPDASATATTTPTAAATTTETPTPTATTPATTTETATPAPTETPAATATPSSQPASETPGPTEALP